MSAAAVVASAGAALPNIGAAAEKTGADALGVTIVLLKGATLDVGVLGVTVIAEGAFTALES